jgi:hypothetical protein
MNLCEHGEYAESIYAHMENTLEESMHIWGEYKETLGAFSQYAKRHKTEHISFYDIPK